MTNRHHGGIIRAIKIQMKNHKGFLNEMKEKEILTSGWRGGEAVKVHFTNFNRNKSTHFGEREKDESKKRPDANYENIFPQQTGTITTEWTVKIPHCKNGTEPTAAHYNRNYQFKLVFSLNTCTHA